MTHWLKYGPLFLLLGMPVLTEVSTCNANLDFDGDGYASDVDCNDEDASIHPSASDLCDGIDQDCDGVIDDDVARIYYTDADGDGYGDETLGASCLQTETSVTRGGDCDDDNASSYPAAPDTAGDGIDQSCDGTDGLAPSVGLPGSTFTTIRAALAAALDGQTVWVGPGTYPESNLSMGGKGLQLRSTEGPEKTILDAQSKAPVMLFYAGETERSVLEGFTLTGGNGKGGGGLYLEGTSPMLKQLRIQNNVAENAGGGMYLTAGAEPSLENVTFTGNTASGDDGNGDGYGGGMYLDESSATLSNVTFTGNTAEDHGGGMYLWYSSPTLSNVTFTGNTAGYGGGMCLNNSSPTLSNVTFTGNTAGDGHGGGMWLDESSPTLKNVTFTGNTAEDGSGGGMYLWISSPILSNVTFTGNSADWSGGGMDLYNSSPTLSNVTFTGNSASGAYGGGGMSLDNSSPTLKNVTFTGNEADSGGGMRLYESSPTLSNVTFTGNTAYDGYGGGMYLYGSSPTLKNVILAYNRAPSGGNFYNYSSSSVKATTSLFYNPSGWGTDNLTPTGTYLTVEPKFLDYADTSSGASCTPGTSTKCLPADLHPALGSPLINAGDPAMSDVDGSRADIGSYGGPGGGSWDVDADGAPDYFWPGEWDNAPSGFDPADYDCDDLDPDVQGC